MPTPHNEDKVNGGQMINYESISFQDYESITVDELKEQTNSLLNLVTEEQRPLRVFMNDGKALLLFPQDLLAPICDSDFRLILLSAMRYAMYRIKGILMNQVEVKYYLLGNLPNQVLLHQKHLTISTAIRCIQVHMEVIIK